MTRIEACEKSIARWEKMRDYSRQENGNSKLSFDIMLKDIGEIPSATYYGLCSICTEELGGVNCGICPIVFSGQLMCGCRESAYRKTIPHASITFNDFADNVDKYMLPCLRKALQWCKENETA
jgi:hypothetical protein